MDVEQLLQRNCHTGPERGDLGRPVLIESAGQSWTVATDGFMMFAAKGHLLEAKPPKPGTWTHIGDVLERAAAATKVQLDVEPLLAIAGPPVRGHWKECSACDGTGAACSCGECPCEADCESGQVYAAAPVRKGVVCERLCDLNRISCLLTGVDGPVYTADRAAWLVLPPEPLFFSGDGWCAVLMPMPIEHERSEDVNGYPRWETGAGQ